MGTKRRAKRRAAIRASGGGGGPRRGRGRKRAKALGIQSKKAPSIGARSGAPSSSGGFAKFSS